VATVNAYSPRRQSSRWLNEDCPRGVLAIYDDTREPCERFTVFYAEPIAGATYTDMVIGFRGMSEHPAHPQGVGIFGEMKAYEVAAYRYRNRNRAATWSGLPDEVKACVRRDLSA
jgi:hypothetical protein